MTIRVAINGYGRIGRMTLRAFYEENKPHNVQIVAVNAPGQDEIARHLTQYDTVHGRFNAEVSLTEDKQHLVVNGDHIRLLSERDPAKLPWDELDIDIVLECTGRFNSKESASAHLRAGAKKVLLSAPGGNDVDATVVYGVNHHVLKASDTVVSNASCTTNCLAPLVLPLQEKIGIENGLMTTIHAYTNDQKLIDVAHKDFRRARAAGQNMIPTKTGAAAAVGLVLPELKGKLDGFAVRVPTINVSMVDLSFVAQRDTSVEEVNQILREAAEGKLKGILAYCDEPLVSTDHNHTTASSIVDALLTRASGRLVKVSAWYDNEWAFSVRMLDTAAAMMAAQ